MKTLFSFIFVVLFSTTVLAEDKISLFKDYYYGMTRQQIHEKGAISCRDVLESDDYGDSLCLPNEVKFINYDWVQLFDFENDTLISVKLATQLSPTVYTATVVNMIKNNYFPVMLVCANEQLYVPKIFKSLGQQKAMAKLNEFEQKALMGDSQFAMVFSDKDYFNKNIDEESYIDFIRNAPINLRMVELDVVDNILALSFMPLGQIVAKTKGAIQGPTEKF